MEKERLALLKAEFEAQLAVIAEIYHKIDLRKKEAGSVAAESLGYQKPSEQLQTGGQKVTRHNQA